MFDVTCRRLLLAFFVSAALCCHAPRSLADSPPLGPIPAAATGPHIDPVAATRAYLATIPAEAKANSDAYFEGLLAHPVEHAGERHH